MIIIGGEIKGERTEEYERERALREKLCRDEKEGVEPEVGVVSQNLSVHFARLTLSSLTYLHP